MFISTTVTVDNLKYRHIVHHNRQILVQRELHMFVLWVPLKLLSVLQLEIKSWLVTGDSLSMELLKTERGNTTVALSRLRELQNTSASHHKTVRPPPCHSKLHHTKCVLKSVRCKGPGFNLTFMKLLMFSYWLKLCHMSRTSTRWSFWRLQCCISLHCKQGAWSLWPQDMTWSEVLSVLFSPDVAVLSE